MWEEFNTHLQGAVRRWHYIKLLEGGVTACVEIARYTE
jgi:hypothetical protein